MISPFTIFKSLLEGKGLDSFDDRSTARTGRVNWQFRQGARQYNRKKRQQVEKAKKLFRQTQEGSRKKMQTMLRKWKGQKLASRKGFRKGFRKAISELYYDAFALGLGSSDTVGAFKKAKLTDKERLWVQSAIREEAGYLDKLVDAVFAGKQSLGTLKRRVDAYIDASAGILEAGKIAGGPTDVLIYWVLEGGPRGDARTCGGCRALHRNNPYTPQTLPTQPRAGLTICKSRCRCKLRITKGKSKDLAKINKKNVKALVRKVEKGNKEKPKKKKKKKR